MLRFLPFVGAIILIGCSSQPASRNPVTVSGQMLDAGGKPLAMKVVSFNPQERDQKNSSSGTDAQGKFTLKLVPGKYHVTLAEPSRAAADGTAGGVTAPDQAGKMGGVPSKYRNPNETPWQITIPDGGQADLVLQIGK